MWLPLSASPRHSDHSGSPSPPGGWKRCGMKKKSCAMRERRKSGEGSELSRTMTTQQRGNWKRNTEWVCRGFGEMSDTKRLDGKKNVQEKQKKIFFVAQKFLVSLLKKQKRFFFCVFSGFACQSAWTRVHLFLCNLQRLRSVMHTRKQHTRPDSQSL